MRNKLDMLLASLIAIIIFAVIWVGGVAHGRALAERNLPVVATRTLDIRNNTFDCTLTKEGAPSAKTTHP